MNFIIKNKDDRGYSVDCGNYIAKFQPSLSHDVFAERIVLKYKDNELIIASDFIITVGENAPTVFRYKLGDGYAEFSIYNSFKNLFDTLVKIFGTYKKGYINT